MASSRALALALALALSLSLAAAAAPCTRSYTPRADTDYNGGDLPNQPVAHVSTPADCAALCCADADCLAFSLNAGAPEGRACYLKSAGYDIGPVSGVDSGCFSGACDAPPPPPPDTYFPWFDAKIPRAERLAMLVANMTQAEAIMWLNDGVPAIPRLGLPAYSWESEALHGVSWNGVATIFPGNIAWAATFDVPLAAEIARVISLEVRAKYMVGRASDGGSQTMAGLSFMTPNNNMAPDPRWGRLQETYGEEPVLTSAITAALVRGLQFDEAQPEYTRMIATSKHFLAYHIESWAGDGQYRLSHSFNVSATDVLQYYFPPFKAALLANVTAVMCAYDGQNGTNPAWPNPLGPEPWGVPMCAHPIMDELLRDPALGWEGYVITDEGSITFMTKGYHHYVDDATQAACLAMNAGTDLALGGEFADTLATCLAQGNVTDARLRQALARVLKAQFDLGWFDSLGALKYNLTDPVLFNLVGDANISTPAARALAHRAAAEALVLLKNGFSPAAPAARTLPLSSAALKKVALIGPAADWSKTSTGSYIGNYSPCEDGPGGGISNDPRCAVSTLRSALAARSAGGGGSAPWSLSYSAGSDINTANATAGFPAALAAAADADVIVFAGGLDTCQESRCSEGEANDRAVDGGQFPLAGLDLPGSQLALLQALREAYPATPLVVVLLNGGPISSPYMMQRADAVLEAWYAGEEAGGAICEALFGETSPAGRMPLTVVASLDDLPPHTDFGLATPPGRTHRYFTGRPLTPFGFGLSYANFSYSALSVQPATLAPTDAGFTVSALVSHAGGSLASDEVAQLYARFESFGAASPPLQQLLAFERIAAIAPGGSAPVSFALPRESLALADAGAEPQLRVLPGRWTLWLGGGPPANADFGGGVMLTGSIDVQ
jgi:beta-glucosidase